MKTTKLIILTVYFLQYVPSFDTTPDPDFGLTPVQMIKNHGYICESHDILTEDGYILTYHRIPSGRDKRKDFDKKPVVLIMHGILSSSADFVSMGPNRSLGYILADQGYDVWLANARGNAWSRKHVEIDVVKEPERFFNFSWHQIGYYDLPAAIDYILNITNNENLYYIGHSQGTTVFLVLTSTRPQYNEKIKLASLMAPVSFMEHQANRLILSLVKIRLEIEDASMRNRIYEVPFVEQTRKYGSILCSVPSIYPICQTLMYLILGADPAQLDQNKIGVMFTNYPSHAALKQVVHYGQLIANGGFSHYDYGRERNLLTYGTEKAPIYNLSQVTTPVAVYYAKNDKIADFKDSKKLIDKLPHVARDYVVPYKLFNHMDFLFAKDVVKLLYLEMIEFMK